MKFPIRASKREVAGTEYVTLVARLVGNMGWATGSRAARSWTRRVMPWGGSLARLVRSECGAMGLGTGDEVGEVKVGLNRCGGAWAVG